MKRKSTGTCNLTQNTFNTTKGDFTLDDTKNQFILAKVTVSSFLMYSIILQKSRRQQMALTFTSGVRMLQRIRRP